MLHSLLRDKVQLPPAGPFLVPAILIASICGSLLQKGNVRSIGVTSILFYLLRQISRHRTGDLIQDGLLPIQGLILFLHWFDFFVLHTPEREYFRLKDKVDETKTRWGNLGWHFDLNTSLRGIGWNWKVKNIPAADAGSRKWTFVRKEVLKAAVFYLLFDLVWYSVQGSIYISPSPPDIMTDTIPRQIFFAWIPALESYYSMNMQFCVFSALTVALGIYKPGDWPPLMGKLKDVNTVRDLWGKFWHQCLRRTLGIPFETLTKFVSITRGTLSSRYVQLYFAFAGSALLHHFPSMVHDLRLSRGSRNQLTYFLLQPLAITFEDFVIYLGRKAGVKKSWKTKALGKVWTFAWFSFCLRFAFQYNSVALSRQVLPSMCKWFIEFAGQLGKIGVVTAGRGL